MYIWPPDIQFTGDMVAWLGHWTCNQQLTSSTPDQALLGQCYLQFLSQVSTSVWSGKPF